MAGLIGSGRWIRTVTALMSAMTAATDHICMSGSAPTRYFASPVLPAAAPSDVTPPTSISASQPMLRSARGQVSRFMPGRNIATAPAIATMVVSMARIQLLAIHRTSIVASRPMTFFSLVVSPPSARRSCRSSSGSPIVGSSGG
jgi:hypothetical protein